MLLTSASANINTVSKWCWENWYISSHVRHLLLCKSDVSVVVFVSNFFDRQFCVCTDLAAATLSLPSVVFCQLCRLPSPGAAVESMHGDARLARVESVIRLLQFRRARAASIACCFSPLRAWARSELHGYSSTFLSFRCVYELQFLQDV